MTNVGSIRRQAKKTNLLVSPRAAELSVIFTEDRQVLTNVPTGSTPFLFRACRTILGTKARSYNIRDTRSIDPRYRDWDDRATWQAVLFRNRRFQSCAREPLPDVVREVTGNVRIDLRFVVCRRTVLAPQPAFQHFRNGIPPLIRSSLALTRLCINRKGDSSTVDPRGSLEWCPHIESGIT